jgi:hypothetical protein
MTSRSRSGSDAPTSEDPSSFEHYSHPATPTRELPPDLPRNLDDRRSVPVFSADTEMYDGWQGNLLSSL